LGAVDITVGGTLFVTVEAAVVITVGEVCTGGHIYNLLLITPTNLTPIAALTQSIENELA